MSNTAEDEKKEVKNQRATFILRFVVSFGAIGLILYLFRSELPAVLQHLKGAQPAFFLAAVLIYFFGLIFSAYRLKLVLNVHRTALSLWEAYYMNVVSLFFNNLLPSSVGGDMVKAYYIYRKDNGRVAAFSAVVVDRLFGLITMVCIGIAAIFLYDQAQDSPILLNSVLLLAAITGLLVFVIFNGRLVNLLCSLHIPFLPALFIEKIREMYLAMHHYRDQRGIITTCILLTIIGQVSYVFTNYLLALSLSIDIPLGFFFFFVPVILIMQIAPSINGIGVREAVYLLYLVGLTTTDKALALSLFTSFFKIFVGILGGVVYAFKGGLESAEEEQQPG